MGKERMLIRATTFILLFGFITLLGISRGFAAEDAPSIKFLKALKDVVNHGDLADTEYSANSLGIQMKFEGKDGKRDLYKIADAGISPVLPFQFYYSIFPGVSVVADFWIDKGTACIQVSEVIAQFGGGGVLSKSIYHFIKKEDREEFLRDKQHEIDMITYRITGETQLKITFTFRFDQCLRRVSLDQTSSLSAP